MNLYGNTPKISLLEYKKLGAIEDLFAESGLAYNYINKEKKK